MSVRGRCAMYALSYRPGRRWNEFTSWVRESGFKVQGGVGQIAGKQGAEEV